MTTWLVILVVFAAFIYAEYCSECTAGRYCQYNPEDPSRSRCYLCPRGYYCPGDSKQYFCPDGTAATNYGQAACTICPKNRSSFQRTYCILPDAPNDIVLLNLGTVNSTRAVISSTSQVFTAGFPLSENYPSKLVLIMIRYADPNEIAPMTLYGSSKTGNPNAQQYEQKLTGATIAVPFLYDGSSEYEAYYFTVETVRPNLVIEAELFYTAPTMRTIQYGEQQYIIDREHGVDFLTYLYFTLENVKQGTRLNITSTTLNDQCYQSLYYSEKNPSNPYPNRFLRDLVGVTEGGSKESQLNYVTKERMSDGNAYMVVSPLCSTDKKPILKLQVNSV